MEKGLSQLKVEDTGPNAAAVVTWLDSEQLRALPSSSYWNDEQVEKGKAFYVADGDAAKLMRYLGEETTSMEQLKDAIRFASEAGHPVAGVGVDAGAGVCWATAILSRIDGVEKIYAVEMSQHRLLHLAPQVLQMFGAEISKITRVVGSFDHMRLDDGSVDFCLLSQALHHANDPIILLGELRRVLKPGGLVLVIGEDPVFPFGVPLKWLRNVAKMMLPARVHRSSKPVYKVLPSFEELFPTDAVTGDHFYRIADYYRMFRAHGFHLQVRRRRRFTVFLAVRPA